jgi:hypothetical protein
VSTRATVAGDGDHGGRVDGRGDDCGWMGRGRGQHLICRADLGASLFVARGKWDSRSRGR